MVAMKPHRGCRRSRDCNAKRGNRRTGASIVELAVCLPLLTVLTLGTIEACSMLYLKQTLKIAAYEGARVGLVPEANSTNVQLQVDGILSGRGIANSTVTLTPANIKSLEPGDFFRVEVSAPCGSNSLIGSLFYQGREVSQVVEMVKE